MQKELKISLAYKIKLQKSCGKAKVEVVAPEINEDLLAKVKEVAAAGMEKVFTTSDKLERGGVYDALKDEVIATLDPEEENKNDDVEV